MKRSVTILSIICMLLIALMWTRSGQVPLVQLEGGISLDVNDSPYMLKDGKLYRVHRDRASFVIDMYDINHIANTYEKRGAQIIAHADGHEFHLPNHITEGFENYKTLRDALLAEKLWTSMTLLSPKAPSVQDYVALKNDIILNDADFLDNKIDIDTNMAHTGRQSLRCFAVNPSGTGKTAWISKTSIDSNLLYLENGDSFIWQCRHWV